jgi:hypothetical protein
LVGVAVKVTLVPEQMVPDGTAATLTPATPFGVTVMVIVPEVAGFPVTHVALDVIWQVIVFPFDRPPSVYVELLVPTLVPFFFH